MSLKKIKNYRVVTMVSLWTSLLESLAILLVAQSLRVHWFIWLWCIDLYCCHSSLENGF